MKQIDALPIGWRIERADRANYIVDQDADFVPDARAAIEAALARPVSSLPLTDLCGPTSRVTIVAAGDSPNIPNEIIVPAILAQLEAAGVRDANITILNAAGGHQASAFIEQLDTLGAEVLSRYNVVSHDTQDLSLMDDLGTYEGVPMAVNFHAAEADVLISTGVVEPHEYAGYSGGSANVGIGCASEAAINEMHSPRFLDDPTVHSGNGAALLRDNLFQRVTREIARRAGLSFVVNVVLDDKGHLVAACAGAPNAVQEMLVDIACRVHEAIVDREDYDIVVADIASRGQPTLYHALHAATNVGLTKTPVLINGGVIIVPAHCNDRAQESHTAKRFYEAVANAPSWDALTQQFRSHGLRAGEHRAYLLARVLQKHHVIVVAHDCHDDSLAMAMLAQSSRFKFARDIFEAADLAEALVGRRPRVLVLPNATHVLPVTGDHASAPFRPSGVRSGAQADAWRESLTSEPESYDDLRPDADQPEDKLASIWDF